MNESTVLSIRPVRTHTVTLPGTSNSGTIAGVGTPDFSTGRRSRSTTSILTGSSQRELTINRLSGKLGAHQGPGRGGLGQRPALRDSSRHRLRHRLQRVHEVTRLLAGALPDPDLGGAEGHHPRLKLRRTQPAWPTPRNGLDRRH